MRAFELTSGGKMTTTHELLSKKTLCSLDKGSIEDLTIRTVHEDGREHVVSEPVWNDRDSIAVLPFDAEAQTVLLVRQMRPAVYWRDQDMILEACAGGIEASDLSVEEACRREAAEELGVVIENLQLAAQVFINPARMVEKANMFLASYKAGSQDLAGRHQDEDEDIEVVEVSLDILAGWHKSGDIRCPRLLILTQALLAKLKETD
ncbi:NUDIX hydrolase [uncultured Cohaesibacter sp.]|uniref:NUDIX hydrolase n=1 Tax=uncultured Cohaesibacter sp. TaxID=1002546 RepID=UPI00292DB67D|nr:NUDIX hydrolase [uncultured Cohaesibacter sp.]